jgi:Rrf2 family transcriptional regulator, iron-sulfur cluster assembly transcription factor
LDLALTRRGDYVLRAAIALARAFSNGKYRTIRSVAREMEMPPTYTPQILNLLSHAGLAQARAGRGGGYRLSRDPGEILLVEVVEAGEGAIRPVQCAMHGGPCRCERMCPLHPAWSAATSVFHDTLATVTLASLACVDRALASGTFPIPPGSHRRPAEPPGGHSAGAA